MVRNEIRGLQENERRRLGGPDSSEDVVHNRLLF